MSEWFLQKYECEKVVIVKTETFTLPGTDNSMENVCHTMPMAESRIAGMAKRGELRGKTIYLYPTRDDLKNKMFYVYIDARPPQKK